MSQTVYDKSGNEIVLCTNNDFNIITLYTGEYHGNEILNIGYSIDNFSHLILTTEETNPKVLVAHILPTHLMLTDNPYKIVLDGECYLYLYRRTSNAIWVDNLSSITSGYINKVYGVKKP